MANDLETMVHQCKYGSNMANEPSKYGEQDNLELLINMANTRLKMYYHILHIYIYTYRMPLDDIDHAIEWAHIWLMIQLCGFRLYMASELTIYGDLMEFKGAYWDLIQQECEIQFYIYKIYTLGCEPDRKCWEQFR